MTSRCGLCDVEVLDWSAHIVGKTHQGNLRNESLMVKKIAESQESIVKGVSKTLAKISDTPECDKIRSVHDKSQLIGEFLEWLRSQGIQLCKDTSATVRCLECGEEYPVGIMPHHESIEQLLARFFSIDLVKAEDERRKILEDLRSGK